MADVFISFSSADRPFAEFVHRHLLSEGVSVFLAPISLQPGSQWPVQILQELRASSWVIFLASRSACASVWVQQEVGGAVIQQKNLIPIVWDMPPSALPGWTGHIQAIDLSDATPLRVHAEIAAIGERIKADKQKGFLLGALLIAGLFAFAT